MLGLCTASMAVCYSRGAAHDKHCLGRAAAQEQAGAASILAHATQLQRSSAIARVGDNDDAHLV